VFKVGGWPLHPKHFGAHRGVEQSSIDLIPLWWPQETGQATHTEEEWLTIRLTLERWPELYNKGWTICRGTTKHIYMSCRKKTPFLGKKMIPSPQCRPCRTLVRPAEHNPERKQTSWQVDLTRRKGNNHNHSGLRETWRLRGFPFTRWLKARELAGPGTRPAWWCM